MENMATFLWLKLSHSHLDVYGSLPIWVPSRCII